LHLTRESKYALLGLAVLAAGPVGKVTSLAEIADAQDLPANFLAKIFQKLARHGLLVSQRGRGRGYVLARSPRAIRMREILEAVEGPSLFDRCLLWNGHCGDTNPCPLHYRLKQLRPAVESILNQVTLAEYLAASQRLGKPRKAPAAKRKPTRARS
jgi:Rrf2 family protein